MRSLHVLAAAGCIGLVRSRRRRRQRPRGALSRHEQGGNHRLRRRAAFKVRERRRQGNADLSLFGRRPGAGRQVQSDGKKSDEKNRGQISSSIFGKDKKKDDKDWTCSASLVFEGGQLVSVNFAHKDVRSPYDWQNEKDAKKAEQMRKEGVPTCGFSLPAARAKR